MADNEKVRNILQIQLETLAKHLSGVKNEDIIDLSKKIYPVISTNSPYLSLYSAIKKQVVITRSKGAMLD